MQSSRTHRIVIVGGAAVGSFCAWELRRHGHTGPITVIDRDLSYVRSSTALSAASIRTQFDTPTSIAMSLHAVELFRRLGEHVDETDADIGYVESGYLILGGADRVDERRDAATMQRSHGAAVATLFPDELAHRFPAIDFDVADDAVTGVRLASGASVPCDVCLLTAGALSGRLAARLGIELPVVPKKRTVFHFSAPVSANGFPMLFDTSGLWVRPEGEGFIGGIQPSVENDPDADDDFEPHRDLFDEVYWPQLAVRVPAMDRLRLRRSWAGHYEVNLLDHNGVIGPHHELRNLVFATGFSGHGLMHAPATGRGVAELLTAGRYETIDLSPFGWERVRDRRPMIETTVY